MKFDSLRGKTFYKNNVQQVAHNYHVYVSDFDCESFVTNITMLVTSTTYIYSFKLYKLYYKLIKVAVTFVKKS